MIAAGKIAIVKSSFHAIHDDIMCAFFFFFFCNFDDEGCGVRACTT